MNLSDLYKTYRSLCYSVAYHLTGSVSDAEDVVQDVYLKLSSVEFHELDNPKAYLCKMTVNRCYDLLKSARVKREQYVGPWLPEPLPEEQKSPEETVVQSEHLSYGVLVLLERLSVVERTVFVLREALGLEYTAIAEIVGKSDANCRKILSRAKEKMGLSGETSHRADFQTTDWIRQFIGALNEGSINQIIGLLSEDVTLLSDGGGKAIAALKPISSREKVLQFIMGIFQNAVKTGEKVRFELKAFNSETGVIVWSGNEILTAALVHLDAGKAKNIYFIRNPEKLVHLYRKR